MEIAKFIITNQVHDSNWPQTMVDHASLETSQTFRITGRARLIRSHSSSRVCLELSRNFNLKKKEFQIYLKTLN